MAGNRYSLSNIDKGDLIMNNNTTPGFYDIVKLCPGGLSLNLPAYDASSNNRLVRIGWNVKQARVPKQFALGIFIDNALTRMYEQGYFKIEPEAQFKKEVEAIYFPVENAIEIIEDDVILTALLKGDRVKIKNIIASGDINVQKVITIARSNIDTISTSMVRDLEKILSVELTIEGEDAE